MFLHLLVSCVRVGHILCAPESCRRLRWNRQDGIEQFIAAFLSRWCCWLDHTHSLHHAPCPAHNVHCAEAHSQNVLLLEGCSHLPRCAVIVECLAILADRSNTHRRAYFRPLHTSQTTRGSPTGPIRAGNIQTALSRGSQSILVSQISFVHASPPICFQPNRHSWKAVDLSILLAAQRIPPTLQGHFEHESPRGAPPKVHNYRIPALAPRASAARLRLRYRHMPG